MNEVRRELARDLRPIALNGTMTFPSRYHVEWELEAGQVLELVDDLGGAMRTWRVEDDAPARRVVDQVVHRLPSLHLRVAP